MQANIKLDSNSVIVAYSSVGKIEGGVDISVDGVPEDLAAGYYRLIDGKIVLDEKLKADYDATQ